MKHETNPVNPQVLDFLPGFLTSLPRRVIGRVIRELRRAKRALALVSRKTVPLFEKAAPALACRIRAWGWIWQPDWSWRRLNKFYDRTVDPYGFASRPYEAEKYAHTLRLLGGRYYDAALEIGAAEGVFTQLLAPFCKSLVAIEVAEAAVERGKKRLAEFENVSFSQAALPIQLPKGSFDLIVVSDVLYYFPKDVVVDLSHQFAARLVPNGLLFTLHYRGNDGLPVGGQEAHELIRRHSQLEAIHDETVDGVGPKGSGYTVTIFKKLSNGANTVAKQAAPPS